VGLSGLAPALPYKCALGFQEQGSKWRSALALCLGGCRSGPPPGPPIGEAYVGPAVLKIRGDIPLQSPPVATVKHGDRLEILQTKRRFLRVRTPAGAEGWTDERHLLSTADMSALRELSRAGPPPCRRRGRPPPTAN